MKKFCGLLVTLLFCMVAAFEAEAQNRFDTLLQRSDIVVYVRIIRSDSSTDAQKVLHGKIDAVVMMSGRGGKTPRTQQPALMPRDTIRGLTYTMPNAYKPFYVNSQYILMLNGVNAEPYWEMASDSRDHTYITSYWDMSMIQDTIWETDPLDSLGSHAFILYGREGKWHTRKYFSSRGVLLLDISTKWYQSENVSLQKSYDRNGLLMDHKRTRTKYYKDRMVTWVFREKGKRCVKRTVDTVPKRNR